MQYYEAARRMASDIQHAVDRFRRGVTLVEDKETGRIIEVPRDLNESDALDFANYVALTREIQETNLK